MCIIRDLLSSLLPGTFLLFSEGVHLELSLSMALVGRLIVHSLDITRSGRGHIRFLVKLVMMSGFVPDTML